MLGSLVVSKGGLVAVVTVWGVVTSVFGVGFGQGSLVGSGGVKVIA